MKTSILIIVASAFQLSCIAQEDTSRSKASYVKLSANYLSNAVYSGRKDSSVVPYFRPSIGYYHKSGIFVTAGLALLVSPSEPMQIDLFSAEAGYEFKISNSIAGAISAVKYFYSDASFASASELKGGLGANISYDNPAITIGLGSELLFSSRTDINANLNLSHSIEVKDVAGLTVNPTFQINAGTQYFNQAYYEFRKYSIPTSNGTGGGSGTNKGKGHSHGGSSSSTTQVITFSDQNKFTILDYELSLPINYDSKRWGLFLIPYYVIPTNAASFALNGSLQKEQLSNTFFFETGVYLKLFK